MLKTTRRWLFYSLLALFLIAAPPLILYAQGYSYDWPQHKITATGGFFIETIPTRAQVYVDAKKKGQSDKLVKRLLPKTYQITLEKSGYQTWQKNLPVLSRQVTKLEKIFLVKQSYPINPAPNQTKAQTFFTQQSQTSLDFVFNNGLLYQKQGANQVQLTNQPLDIADNDKYIIINPNPEQIAVLAKKQLYWLDKTNKRLALIANNITGAVFDDSQNRLLFWTDNEIWLYDLSKGKELITRLSQEIKQVLFLKKTNEHLVFASNKQIALIELDSRDKRNIFKIIDLSNSPDFKMALDAANNSLYFYYQDGWQYLEL